MKKTLSMLLPLTFFGSLAACGGEKGDKGDPGDPGLMGDKGDKGDPGNGGANAAVSLLTPTSIFAGRSTLLQISGVGTHFADASTVDFGDPAIKVQSVQAGSGANLRVAITVGVDAKM